MSAPRLAAARSFSFVSVTGFKELRRNIEQLDKGMQRKIYQKAAGKAGRLVVKVAKSKVPTGGTGTLAANIVHRAASRPRSGLFGVKITVRGGAFRSNRTAHRKGKKGKDYKPDAVERYYRFVETGTKYHEAQAFLLPSLSEQRGPIMDIFKRELAAGLNSVAATLPKS